MTAQDYRKPRRSSEPTGGLVLELPGLLDDRVVIKCVDLLKEGGIVEQGCVHTLVPIEVDVRLSNAKVEVPPQRLGVAGFEELGDPCLQRARLSNNASRSETPVGFDSGKIFQWIRTAAS